MPLPIYRSGTIDMECPCCGTVFVADSDPITCPKRDANIELFADAQAAQDRVAEYGGKTVRKADGIWMVAFCRGEAENDEQP
jgi:hypothetical protein